MLIQLWRRQIIIFSVFPQFGWCVVIVFGQIFTNFWNNFLPFFRVGKFDFKGILVTYVNIYKLRGVISSYQVAWKSQICHSIVIIYFHSCCKTVVFFMFWICTGSSHFIWTWTVRAINCTNHYQINDIIWY